MATQSWTHEWPRLCTASRGRCYELDIITYSGFCRRHLGDICPMLPDLKLKGAQNFGLSWGLLEICWAPNAVCHTFIDGMYANILIILTAFSGANLAPKWS